LTDRGVEEVSNNTKLKQQIEEMEASLQRMVTDIATNSTTVQDAFLKLREMRSELDKEEKWEPKGGKYFIHAGGRVREEISDGLSRKFGVERKTREAAEKARDEMRVFNRLLAYRDEFAPGYAPDWNDATEKKAYVYWSHASASSWLVGTRGHTQDAGAVYMPFDVAIDLARKLNSGEVVL
jgi:hypothetical protein